MAEALTKGTLCCHAVAPTVTSAGIPENPGNTKVNLTLNVEGVNIGLDNLSVNLSGLRIGIEKLTLIAEVSRHHAAHTTSCPANTMLHV